MIDFIEGFETPTKLDFSKWQSGDAGEYFADPRLNFHTLANFHRDPRLFKAGYFQELTPSAAMNFGSALHCKLLQPDEFAKRYAVFNAPINSKTGEPYGPTSKTYLEALAQFAADNPGREYIKPDEAELINRLIDEFYFHPVAPQILDGGELAVEQSICGNFYGGPDLESIPVKGRIDAYSAANGLIDVKTTATLDDYSGRDRFRYAVYDFKYIPQLAFYHKILRESYGAPFVPVWLIVFETSPPNRVAVYAPTPQTLSAGYDVIDVWLGQWNGANTQNRFKSKFDDVQILENYDPSRDY